MQFYVVEWSQGFDRPKVLTYGAKMLCEINVGPKASNRFEGIGAREAPTPSSKPDDREFGVSNRALTRIPGVAVVLCMAEESGG